jgi:hypothetical protein
MNGTKTNSSKTPWNTAQVEGGMKESNVNDDARLYGGLNRVNFNLM